MISRPPARRPLAPALMKLRVPSSAAAGTIGPGESLAANEPAPVDLDAIAPGVSQPTGLDPSGPMLS